MMACHLFGAKPLPEPVWAYISWILKNKFQWNIDSDINIFIQENVFQNVVFEMAINFIGFNGLRNEPLALITLQGRHNGHDGVLNHQPHHCLFNRLFRHRSKKTSKLGVTGLFCGEFTGDRWIPHTNGQ